MYTIIEKNTGKVLYVKFDDLVSEEQIAIPYLRTIDMKNPHWDFNTNEFYDKPIENEL